MRKKGGEGDKERKRPLKRIYKALEVPESKYGLKKKHSLKTLPSGKERGEGGEK